MTTGVSFIEATRLKSSKECKNLSFYNFIL